MQLRIAHQNSKMEEKENKVNGDNLGKMSFILKTPKHELKVYGKRNKNFCEKNSEK